MMPSHGSKTCYKKYPIIERLGEYNFGEWLCSKVLFTKIALMSVAIC
jgi:hypothetical protein